MENEFIDGAPFLGAEKKVSGDNCYALQDAEGSVPNSGHKIA